MCGNVIGVNMITNRDHNSLVDLKFLETNTGFKKSFIYNQVARGNLAKPKKIERRNRWSYQDYLDFKSYLESRADG